jgi:hypothetical protein
VSLGRGAGLFTAGSRVLDSWQNFASKYFFVVKSDFAKNGSNAFRVVIRALEKLFGNNRIFFGF